MGGQELFRIDCATRCVVETLEEEFRTCMIVDDKMDAWCRRRDEIQCPKRQLSVGRLSRTPPSSPGSDPSASEDTHTPCSSSRRSLSSSSSSPDLMLQVMQRPRNFHKRSTI